MREVMSKLIVRWTVILVAVYLIVCCLVALVFRVDIWRQFYYLMFELCVCLCVTAQGAYHCKYLHWTAYTIFIEDCIATTDTFFGYIPDNIMAIVSPTILTAGLATTTALAIRHYIRTRRIRNTWRTSHLL